jgi:hypothetical protein
MRPLILFLVSDSQLTAPQRATATQQEQADTTVEVGTASHGLALLHQSLSLALPSIVATL